jgi:hypothetical protein
LRPGEFWRREAETEEARRQAAIDFERLRVEAAEQAEVIARQRAEVAEAAEASQRKLADLQAAQIENERLRREAAEQAELVAKKTALLEKERARRSRLVAILASIGVAVAASVAVFEYWKSVR